LKLIESLLANGPCASLQLISSLQWHVSSAHGLQEQGGVTNNTNTAPLTVRRSRQSHRVIAALLSSVLPMDPQKTPHEHKRKKKVEL